jgi:cytochrome b6-f complex iron-sulfur subunit
MTDAAAAAPAPGDARRATQAEAQPVPLSRREFLNYMWGASMAVFMAGAGGVTVWFALPRFREGEFGGIFTVPVDQIPPPDSPPLEFPEGRFWLVNVGEKTVQDDRQPGDYPLETGVRVLYKVCVHLGCLYKWVPTNDRFECPCHGSKYLKTGTRVDGPARRNLDQFITEVVDASGEVLARTEPSWPPDGAREEGTSLPIPQGAVALRIDTGRRVSGAPNTKPGGGV